MNQTPNDFYNAQIEQHTIALKKLKKQLALSSAVRISVFLGVVTGVYVAFGNAFLVIGVLLIGISLFVYLVAKHSDLQYKHALREALRIQCVTEIEVLTRNLNPLRENGEKFKDSNHAYSQDIDLFGDGSFYHYMNRTALKMGAEKLAGLLTENTIKDIPEKQEAIRELAGLAIWRQHFSAVASLVKTEVSANQVTSWLQRYNAFAPSWIRVGYFVFSSISVTLLLCFFLEAVSGYVVFAWFLLGLAISGRYLKKVNELSQHTSKVQSTFEQFHKLISEIELQTFTSSILSQKKAIVHASEKKASTTLKKFAKHLDALDQRNNMLIGVLLNGFMIRDLYVVHHIERWIEQHTADVEQWFKTITFFDAYNSLGNYAFNHRSHVFPEITALPTTLQVKGGGHPLLPPETMVRNNFEVSQKEFFIVTGANMAGKSTFLRTVSLHIVMGNVGLPICAERAVYHPIKLITSMRTTDSLNDGESYFFSELKRLQYIVEKIQTDRYFIVLDEILKGTNSTDKAIGSRKFVEKLVKANATGIIATHDLSLCEVANDITAVKNYYFDAQIREGELYFDYCFKPGICENMNASFLLKKMNIVD